MPHKPQHRCNWPGGCQTLVTTGRCPKHTPPKKPSKTRTHTQSRETRGYTHAHRTTPLDPTCSNCGTTQNLQRAHIIAIADGGTNDPNNHTTLCASCNNKQMWRDRWNRTQPNNQHHHHDNPNHGPFD